MDSDARIPILSSEDVATVAAAASDGHGNAATAEEDGSLRIVLPVAEPCNSGAQGEITVCAAAPELNASVEAPPENPAPSNPLEIRLGKNATLGPQVGPAQGAMGGSGVEAKVTLRIVF